MRADSERGQDIYARLVEVSAKIGAFAVFGPMLYVSVWGAFGIGRAALATSSLKLWAEAADRVAMALFLLLVLISYLIRPPAAAKAGKVIPRIAAFIGGFLITPLALLPFLLPVPSLVLGLRNPMLSFVGVVLTLSAHFICVLSIIALGRSFSLFPEARRLVTHGIYRFVRHPMYVAEELAAIGVVLGNISILAVSILLVHMAVQLYRIRNEERLLSASFPEYRDYAARTGMLIPYVRWPRGWW